LFNNDAKYSYDDMDVSSAIRDVSNFPQIKKVVPDISARFMSDFPISTKYCSRKDGKKLPARMYT
jgi:hypothetical protein